MGTLAALRAAEEVAKLLDPPVKWGRVEFDVVNGEVHSIDVVRKHHRKDAGEEETVQLREGE